MKLNEQDKKRLQKLAGINPGNKATPKRGGTPTTDTWYGCSVCGEDTQTPGETACLPLVPFTLTFDAPGGNGDPINDPQDWGWLSAYEAGNIYSNEEGFPFGELLGSDGQYYDGYSHLEIVGPTLGNSYNQIPVLVNDYIFSGQSSYDVTPETWCPMGGEQPKPEPEPELGECAEYPAACCLQQIYGQDVFGTTIEYQGEEVTIPSAEECEGMAIIWDYAGSTPYPHGDNTFYDGVEYTHNPYNSFKQGCCYPLL